MLTTVKYYGCVKCQKQHWQDIDPKIFEEHKYFQSKHGIQEMLFSNEEKAKAYIEDIKRISREYNI